MDNNTFLRIIIFLVFLAIGVLVGGLIGNYKKIITPQVTPQVTQKSTQECPGGICPPPKEGWLIRWKYWKGDKK